MSVVVSREAFLKPSPRLIEDVPLPEFGEGVVVPVWGFTARERTVFESSLRTKKGTPIEARQAEIRERLIVATCKDRDGKALFSDADIRAISEQSAAVVERIVNVAMRLCGMSSEDVETLAKNSDATPSADSR